MKTARWLALGVGAGLGVLAACFNPPGLDDLYLCSPQGTCPDPGLSCVDGYCCKEDGGEPACPTTVLPDGGGPPDGGPDAGPDGGPPPDGGLPDGGPDAGPGPDGGADGGAGADAGQDAGCVDDVPPPVCPVNGKVGACAAGQLVCDGGSPYCKQVVFPVTEICGDPKDDDCEGTTDNYPCRGGPPNFFTPSPDYVLGAQIVNASLGSGYPNCLYNNAQYGVTAGYLDGGNWRGRGVATNFFYAMKADGGTWDLSRPGQQFRFIYAGYFNQSPNLSGPTANYPQPIVFLCGPGGSLRYNPRTGSVLTFNGILGFQTNNAVIDLATDGGGEWSVSTGTLNLAAVSRVEVMMTPRDPFDGGTPAFDAGITLFGFSPP
ncbi:MAG TPA: hypothetical protein VIG99_14455 [Myxococcaceae bacterium]|jgi:hypothetical protein